MAEASISKELGREVKTIRQVHKTLEDDAAFVLWFVREHLLDINQYDQAIHALTGISGDKSVDGLLIDDRYKRIHLVQGKYHKKVAESTEGREAIIAFAALADLPLRKADSLETYFTKLDAALAQKLTIALDKVKNDGYKLILYFLTTARVTKTTRNDAQKMAADLNDDVDFHIYDGNWVSAKFQDYLVGAAPSVPSLRLRMAAEERVSSSGYIYRYDTDRGMASYIFSMTAADVGKLFKDAGYRLFARNIRGFLGPGDARSINKAIKDSVEKEPENFWYYNNGVTIVCSAASDEREGEEVFLSLEDPSIINGQQTTISLSESGSQRASVIVRVIVVPRRQGDEVEHSAFINSIVKATNRQNAIKPADLVANDSRQVFLERLLREYGYLYQRKRRSSAEERALFGPGMYKIGKEYLAQIVAAIMYGPRTLRRTDDLFEDPYYEHLFASDDPSFYLGRFWLMQNVKRSVTSTEMTRAYWLVLKFAWTRVGSLLETRENEIKFRRACEEEKNNILAPLNKGLKQVFRAADKWFRATTNDGADQDIRSFFTDTDVVKDFAKYWRSRQNKEKASGESAFNKFISRIESASDGK